MSTDIIAITFPIYAAIAIGFVVVKLGWFGQSDMRTLGNYVLDIALPALLFNAIATRDFAEIFNIGYMLIFGIGGLITILVSYTWFSFTKTEPQKRAVAVMGTACPNSGFIGFPIMLLTFPDIAGVILALNMLVENILLIPICLVLMQLSRRQERLSISRQIIDILLGVLKRPMIIGLLLGLVVSVFSFPLPDEMTGLFQMLAASASALSLVVIGGTLASLSLNGDYWKAGQIAFGKLLVHPFAVALAVVFVAAIGSPIADDFRAAVILSAAMPMFGIYGVLAQENGHEGVASIAMLIATSASFVTLSVLIGVLIA